MTPNSCHPLHTIKNIPKCIADRVYKICSEPSVYLEYKDKFVELLNGRGYHRTFILSAFSQTESVPRKNYYAERDQTNVSTKIVNPLIIDYNPALPNATKIINEFKHLLNLDQDLAKIIPPETVILTFKIAKNLQDILTSSKFSSNSTEEGGCYKCTKNRCSLCKHFLEEGKLIKSYHTKSTFKISNKLNCESQGVIYLVNDIKCKRNSVGSTINDLKTRWAAHKTHIKRNHVDCELAQHFNEQSSNHTWTPYPISAFDNSLSPVLKVMVIDQVKFNKNDSKIVKMRKVKEREGYWQTQLKTLTRYGGLNILDELAIRNRQEARSDSMLRL